MSREQVFLQEADRFVSNSRVILGGTTYSTSNITSVSKRISRPNAGCAIILIAFGGLGVLFAGLIGFAQSFSEGLSALMAGGIISILFGGLFLVPGILWLRSLKPTFFVVFTSASSETEALSSKDEELVDRIVAAVNEAIVARG